MHPDSPLIDGAIPRTDSERVDVLLNYAESLYAERQWEFNIKRRTRYKFLLEQLREEFESYDEDSDTPWYEVEDEVIETINEMLPDPWYMTLNPDDPGTVVIWNKDEEEDDDA